MGIASAAYSVGETAFTVAYEGAKIALSVGASMSPVGNVLCGVEAAWDLAHGNLGGAALNAAAALVPGGHALKEVVVVASALA